MQIKLAPEISEIVQKIPFLPAVTIIAPFNPKMSRDGSIQKQLTYIKKIVTRQVLENYNDDLGALVLQKLIKVCKSLNFGTRYQSVAIFVSPLFEKVVYFDFPVETQISVDDQFNIQQVVHAKKNIIRYLLLDVTSSPGKLYFGNSKGMSVVKINHITAGSESASFWKLDKELEVMMKAYSVPVFVIGQQEQLEYFRKYTGNGSHIVKYITTGNIQMSEPDFFNAVKLYFKQWGSIRIRLMHNQIMQAHHEGKLICGINEVSDKVNTHKPRLLIIKQSYLETYRNVKTIWDGTNLEHHYNRYSCVRNNLDEIIQTVLEEGGNVDFVEDDVLEGYHSVCLIIN